MPVLLGSGLADASGTLLEDASSSALGEPDLDVALSTAGLLREGGWNVAGPWWEVLVEQVVLGVVAAVAGPTGPTIEDVQANIDLVRAGIGADGIAPYNVLEEVRFISSEHENDIQAVLDALDALPAGGLTTEEHDHLLGLDPPDPATIGQAVWNYEIPHIDISGNETDQVAALYLRESGEHTEWLGASEGWEIPGSRWWRLWCPVGRQGSFEWALDAHPSDYFIPADPDFTHVEAGDTLLSFLEREYPSISWSAIPTPRGNEARRLGYQCTGAGFTVYVGPAFTLPELNASHADLVVGEGIEVDVAVPPIWPGESGVTYGTPVALTQQMAIDATMDGVVVHVTGVDANTLYYTYGGEKAYRHIGGIAFVTDGGELEQWQALGFEDAIYTPRTMRQAAGVRLFTGRGAAGTLTPWTVSTP